MSVPELRPHQATALDEVEGHIAFGTKEICLSAPMSWGKTLWAAQLIKNQVEAGKSIVFMMNLTQLVSQTMDALREMDVPFRVMAAEFDGQEFDHQSKVTIVMQQTLYARIDKVKNVDCDILIIDEFHLSFRTDTMEIIKNKLKPDTVLGLSGTPWTATGEALPHVELVETIGIKKLTDKGYLAPMKTMVVKFAEDVDLTDAGSGEYSENYLNTKINNESYNEQVVLAWQKVASNMKTIVFSTGIEHSEALAAQFKAKGINAEAYHSKLSKDETKRIFESFKSNQTQVLISVSKIIFGFNMTDIECAIACRPSKTRRLVAQARARAIRLHPEGKPALLLDCAGWTTEHGLYDEPYNPPKAGDKKALRELKEKSSITVMPSLLDNEDPIEITRELIDFKIKELKQKEEQVEQLGIKDLIAIFDTIQDPYMIIKCANEISKRKGPNQIYPKRIRAIADEWDEAIENMPEYKTRLLKTLRTRSKNIVADNKGLYRLGPTNGTYTSFIHWLMDQPPYSYVNQQSIEGYGILESEEIPF